VVTGIATPARRAVTCYASPARIVGLLGEGRLLADTFQDRVDPRAGGVDDVRE
jgi:hypothetical protein